MWAEWPASCQAARMPVELIDSAGRFPSRLAVVDVYGRVVSGVRLDRLTG